MSGKRILPTLSEREAVANLVKEAQWLTHHAQWYSPYNGARLGKGRPIRAPLNELRRALLALRLAQRRSGSARMGDTKCARPAKG